MYNLFKMLRIEKEGVDVDRLAKSLEMATKNHPAFSTIIKYTEDGDLIQQYDPQMNITITPEKISEAEFGEIKDTLVQPFKIVNSPLSRCRLFETEEAVYLFFDVHHILYDGTSFKVFLGSVINAYMRVPLKTDYYYLALQKREQVQLTDFYKDVRVSWIYNGRDDLISSSSIGLFFRDLPVAISLHDKMTLRDILAEVQEQVKNGIKYSCYPYNEIEAPPVDDDDTCILYQRDLRDVGDFGGLAVKEIEIRQNKAASQAVLDIQILEGEAGLQYVFDYAASRYKKETMSEFQNLFKRVIATIVNSNTDGYTFEQLKKDVRWKKVFYRA